MARAITEAVPILGQRLHMSSEEWHAWWDAEHRGEWVDGEVMVWATLTIAHQRTLLFLTRLLATFNNRHEFGEVFISGTEMWLAERRTARMPDALSIARANRGRLDADRLNGPADLVFEIVSDDSTTRDRRDKLAEYEAAGVPEYWIVDPRPNQQRAAFHQLGPNGRYREVGHDEHGRCHSRALPGFWFEPAWLWQDPLPNLDDLSRVIAGDPQGAPAGNGTANNG